MITSALCSNLLGFLQAFAALREVAIVLRPILLVVVLRAFGSFDVMASSRCLPDSFVCKRRRYEQAGHATGIFAEVRTARRSNSKTGPSDDCVARLTDGLRVVEVQITKHGLDGLSQRASTVAWHARVEVMRDMRRPDVCNHTRARARARQD